MQANANRGRVKQVHVRRAVLERAERGRGQNVGSRHGRETTNGKGGAVGSRPDVVAARDFDAFANVAEAKGAAAPPAAATRRTLVFPTSEVMRSLEPGAPERKLRARSLFRTDEPEAKTLLRALGGYESSDEIADDRSSGKGSVRDVPSARPSELSTVPSLASKGIAADSSASLIELSASELQSERELSAALRLPPLPKRVALGDRDEADGARAITDAPPRIEKSEEPARPSRRRTVIGLFVSHGMVALIVALVAGSGRAGQGTNEKIVREPNIALSERTPLASPPLGFALPPPPSGGCATSGDARLLASRAQIGPGLDVSVLETGFGVALAAGTREAVGLRVEGSGLRIAETVRVKSPSLVSHAVVESGREEESDNLDVRVDSDEARTVIGGGEAPPFRIVARGGAVMALLDDLRGVRVRNLWFVPGTRFAAAPMRAPARAPSAKSSLYRPPGFTKVADPPRPAAAPGPVVSDVVRAVGRDDGGAVIALRRPSTLWLGVTDASLAPAGPLVSIVRKGATVGSPAVAPWGGGGAVAWAERQPGEREWTVVVAAFTPDGEGATTVGPVRVIGKGMSPTLAALPDGDLLLAHADGPSGAHRVVAVRLGRELEPRGEPLVVSPDSINAGQPVAAVRPDGRAIVAFFAADRGSPPRAATVFARPLACDPGF